MSDTLKFLKQQAQGPSDQPFALAGQRGFEQAGLSTPDAAQDFLAKQMAKNKFLDTLQPIENVGKHLTTDPYAFGEGSLPGGEGYNNQLSVLNQKEIDDWHAANPNYKKNGGKTDYSAAGGYANMYQTGKWGAGKLSAEELAAKFGLDRSNPAGNAASHDDREIWGVDKSGKQVYIGRDTGNLRGGGELASAHASQKHPDEGSHSDLEGMSLGDINGAILALWDGSGGEPAEPPKPKMGIKPIEHSEEIRQAKDRVKAHEEGIESGKTSKEIFGNATFIDKYQQDFSKGADGIGTNASSSAQQSATSATQSFLDNKLSQVKKTLSPA